MAHDAHLKLLDSTNDGNQRAYGLDLLRFLAMLFVVTLHVLGHGGVLEAVHGVSFASAYLLESLCICAVNCFVLISGYCLCNKAIKCRRMLSLWFEALFYSITITIFGSLYSHLMPTPNQVFGAFTPIFSSQWWFLSQYFALFCCMFFLNHALASIKKDSAKTIVVVLLTVFSFLPFLFHSDPFNMKNGYSFAWFSVLYLIGGCIRIGRDSIRIDKKIGLAAYFVGSNATFAGHVFLRADIGGIVLTPYKNYLLAYTSPFVTLSSLGLFWFFLNLNIKGRFLKKALTWITPSVFAIYLISDHPIIRATFISNRFAEYACLSPHVLPLVVFATVLSLGVVCLLLDKIRGALFKLLKLDIAAVRIGSRLDSILMSHAIDQ